MRKIKCSSCGKETDVITEKVFADNTVKEFFACEHCGALHPVDTVTISDLTAKEHASDPVNSPSHYVGQIECIDYLRDKLTMEEFTGFCMGNVLKYSSRWRKKDGLQDLKKAKVYLEWAIETAEKENANG